jgi:hypothetical protein
MRRILRTFGPCGLCAMALALMALAVVPARPAAAADQSSALAEMQRKLDQSLQAIQALTERVRELEAKQAASVAAPAAAPAAAGPVAPDSARLEAAEQKLEQLEQANANRNADDTGLPLHGFADVGAGTHNPINPDLKGFNVGNLDFYLAPRLGDRTRALFELNTEVSSEGVVDVDLERAQIGYQFSDQATLWMGRYHTPYGYLNTALHHGSWINNSLRRPKFLQFEDNGGIMPAHTVGLWVTGARHVGGGKFLYDAYAGNSQQIAGGVLDMRNAGNTNGNLSGGGRIGYQFSAGAAEGLTLGVHAFTGRIADDAAPANLTRVYSYGGYVVYDTDQWESIAEIYLFDNEDQRGGGTHRSDAGFVQLGHRSSWGVPYARYERAALAQSDRYFAALQGGGSYYRVALGARFDLDLKSALKLELANTRLTDRTREQYGEGLVQYAIRF